MKKIIKSIIKRILSIFPLVKKIIETSGTEGAITFRTYFFQKILGFNKKAYWPTHHSSVITHPNNIEIGIGTAPGSSLGCYIQGNGGIKIGDYTIIAPNVGIISGNHTIIDYRQHENKEVKIGRYCWLGMGSIVLPGVELGDHTVVAAGAVVTEPFKEGYCVVGGIPAKIIKKIDRKGVVEHENKYKYYGYYPEKKYLKVRKLKF